MLAEVFGQGFEQRRVAGRVRRTQVIDRLHDPTAHQVGPDPVDDHLGKIRVLGTGHPVGQGFAGIRVRVVGLSRLAEEGLGRQDFTAQGMLNRAPFGCEHDLFASRDRRREPDPLRPILAK